ncbi:WD40 repeat-like protein, partial [Phlegmacium glaucopus]
YSPDGMHIVSVSYDDTARIWNTDTGECKAELKGHSRGINSALFSPDGLHIVSASDDDTVRIWNTATGECEAVLNGHTSVLYMSDQSQLPNLPSIPNGVFIHHYTLSRLYPSLQFSFLDIHQDMIYHTMNPHKIWIPPPFHRPVSVSYHSSKMCLGYATGEVLLLEVCMAL